MARVQATCGQKSPISGGHREKVLWRGGGGGRGGGNGRRRQAIREFVIRVVISGMHLAQVTTGIFISGGGDDDLQGDDDWGMPTLLDNSDADGCGRRLGRFTTICNLQSETKK